MLSDLKYALRQLAKAPGFTAIAILTLALGIGATTAIFSALDAVLLRPQPYPEPERLVNVFERVPAGGRNSVSGNSFKDWREHQTTFDSLFIYANDQFDLTGRGEPEKINALSASAAFTRTLGIAPLLGRGFLPEDERIGGNNNVVVLTERFWRTRFNGDPAALGQTLQLDGRTCTIIGVLRHGAWFQHDVQIFVPYVLTPNSYLTSHDVNRARVIGRLAPGVTPAQGETELNAIKQRLNATYPASKQNWGVVLQSTQEMLAEGSRSVLLLLFGAVGMVLLIACANVANLLLARASARQREIAVRAALGASGARIVRQVLTESLLLAFLGGAAGVLIATWSIELLGTLVVRYLPATMTPQVDLRVLGFSLLASCGTGLLFGLVPAWRARRPELTQALKSGSPGATDGGRTRSQASLVVAEVAITAVLLVATGLLLRGLDRTVNAHPGFDVKNVLMFDLTMPFNNAYQGDQRRIAFLERALAEIRAVPGVVSAATTDNLPFNGGNQGYFFSREEQPDARQDRVGEIRYVSPDFFATLGAPLLRGRPILPEDNRANAPRVLVVNQTLVNDLFGAEDPLGRRLRVGNDSWEIVGVVGDLRTDSLPTPRKPRFYAAQWHFPWASAFVVRTQGDPLAATAAVAAAIHRIDASLPLVNPRALEHAMETAFGPQKLVRNLLGTFAALALLLACIGLYGVMSYAVSSRQRELSIRVALGAMRADILRLIVGRGARLLLLGLGLGLAGALVATQLLASRIPGIDTRDPLAFVGAAIILAAVALFACWLPARRATKVDPMLALRAE